MAVASLVLGIIALVFCWMPGGLSTVSLICGIIGIILGALGSRTEKKGAATAGLVMSIIAVALGLLTFAMCGGCVACAACTSACAAF